MVSRRHLPRRTPEEKREIADRVLAHPRAREIVESYRLHSPVYAETRAQIQSRIDQYEAAIRALSPPNRPRRTTERAGWMAVLLRSGVDDDLSLPPVMRELRFRAACAARSDYLRISLRENLRGNAAERILVADAALHFYDVTGELPTVTGRDDETPFTIVAETMLDEAGARVGKVFVRDAFKGWFDQPPDGESEHLTILREAMRCMVEEGSAQTAGGVRPEVSTSSPRTPPGSYR